MASSIDRADVALLGKLFAAEVEAAVSPLKPLRIYQTRSKRIQALKEQGLVREAEERIGHGRFAVTVKGWELTAAGHLCYCMSCDDEEEVKR